MQWKSMTLGEYSAGVGARLAHQSKAQLHKGRTTLDWSWTRNAKQWRITCGRLLAANPGVR